MEQTNAFSPEQASSSSVGQIFTDQSSSGRHDKTFKKLWSNNDELNSEVIGSEYAQSISTEQSQEPKRNLSKKSPSATSSSAEKKKKKQTPPKPKSNQTGNNSNHKQRYNTQMLDDGMLNMNDSPVYAFNTTGDIKTRSKKNNLNHLLNFSYDHKASNESYEYETFSKQFWSNKIAKSSYFSKEQFLQANCQFVVKNVGDYSMHMVDPDLMVEWNKIEEIHIDSNELISCPICLFPPQAGKMTKCGHMFCWTCILHYLSLSDKPWRKCPICYESIYKADLKSVLQTKFEHEFKVGSTIQFELMSKLKSKFNTIIMPYPLIEQLKSDEQNLSLVSFDLFNDDVYSNAKKYLKILSKSGEEIQSSILDNERVQLTKLRDEVKDQPEVCFVDEALNLLLERETALKTLNLTPKKIVRKSKSPKKTTIVEDMENLEIKTSEAPSDKKKIVPKQSQTDFVYFYQSLDGQRIYINALNARMMMSEYSSFANCPQNLSARIVASESFFMSEDNRKRFRYLSHLPLHSEFKIVEVELTEEYVSKETRKLFDEEIRERKRNRDRKLMKEKRLADRSDPNVYDPHYYNTSAMNESVVVNNTNLIDYTNDFPEASTSPATSSSGVSSGSNGTVNKDSIEQQPASFAQMTRPGSNSKWAKANNQIGSTSAWPTLNTQPSNNLDQQQSQITNGWLSAAKLGPTLGRSKKVQGPPSPWATKNSMAAEYENEELEETDYMPARDYRESFFCGIDESLRVLDSKKMDAWEAKLLGVNKSNDEPVQTKPQQISRKKKKTGKLLFST